MQVNRVNQGGIQAVRQDIGQSVPRTDVIGVNKAEDPALRERDREGQQLLSKEEAQQAVEVLNKVFGYTKTHIQFQLHEKLDEYYVVIINDETNEVIREIPPKKFLDMIAAMWEQLGLIIDKKI